MKNITKKVIISITMLALVLTLAMPVTAEAASRKAPKLNKTKVTLTITKKKTKPAVQLKVKNISKKASKKVTWKSSNRKVVTVSKKGKVVAKKKGNAVITAKVGKKTLKCRVVVKDSRAAKKKTSAKKPANDNKPADTKPAVKPSEPSKPAHKHSYVATVTKAPTCTEAGTKTYTCSCGDSYTKTIPAKGHSYKDTNDTKTLYVWKWYNEPVYVHHCACGMNFATAEEWDTHVYEMLTTIGTSNGHSQYGEELHNDSTGHYVTVEITGPTYGHCTACGANDDRYQEPSDSETEW